MQLKAEIVEQLEMRAAEIRALALKSIHACGSGHPGGSLSEAEILACLYFQVMRIQPADPNWPERDRFILSKAHSCHALYAVLALRGFFPVEECFRGGHPDSLLQGHTDMNSTPGLDFSGGSLGQGLSVACGMAWAAKRQAPPPHVYCLVGDGECQEGQIWEAAMSAAQYRLDNLTCLVDRNKVQAKAAVHDEVDIEPLAGKWQSFGWQTIEVDGHDIAELLKALYRARWQNRTGKPTAIIAHTVKGRGVPWMEFNPAYHTGALTKGELDRALGALKAAEDNPHRLRLRQ